MFAGLSFDPTTDQLYLTNANNNVTTRDLGAIYVMQMTTVGNAVSLVHTFDTATLVGQTPATVDSLSAPSTTFFDVLPTLGALSGTATSPVEQGAAVTLLTGAPGISDPDGSHLASATVQITGGTFTSNENSSSDDHLGVLDGGTFKTSGTITGTSITIGYTSATETLTLSGYDTLTNYQAALGKVQYETIGDNPTNYGSNQTRTLTWQANDGAVGNPTGPTTGTTTTSITAVNDPPTLSGTVASVGFTEQGAAVTLSPSASVGDPDDHNLSGATVSVTGCPPARPAAPGFPARGHAVEGRGVP